jgi:cobalt-precorrin 5A hydrolase / precorrin-3B C17-methyltransferase
MGEDVTAGRDFVGRRGIAVVAVTRGGARLGAEIAASIEHAELHVAERWSADVDLGVSFSGPLSVRLASLFPRVEGLVIVLALGATVRLIAPLLSSKHDDPAVVVVDEAGRHAVSVVGGHGAGANALAERIADVVGASAVVTTASDVRGLPAVDLIGREHGWKIEASPETVTRLSAAVVNGETVGIYQDAGEGDVMSSLPDHWLRAESLEELADAGSPALVVSDRLLEHRWEAYRDRWVLYRPPTLVLGVGCSLGATADELGELARETLAGSGLAWGSLAVIATIDRRLNEPGVLELATRAGLPLRGFSAEQLARRTDMANPSADVALHVGTPGVCEPAALIASEGGELVVPKRKSSKATAAVARRRRPSAATRRGTVTVVGLGPGAPELMTARARQALREADAIVGYGGYLDSIRTLVGQRRLRPYRLGQEAERARASIELARAGGRVALVSSGDAGVYGMAGLVFELLGDEIVGEAGSPAVEVVPGVTAATAAAALLGAPLMLDFAVISLSDLLVPWETIERRVVAAAEGDFVVVLYNPASARRTHQIREVQEIMLRRRPPSTLVGIVRDAYRPDQSVTIVELADLHRAPIDMRTVVVVGNSDTVRVGGRMVTRRGYAARRDPLSDDE